MRLTQNLLYRNFRYFLMIETVGFEGSKGGLDFNKIVGKVSFRNGVIHKTKYKIQNTIYFKDES